jgi:hypothetical protein
MEMAMEETEVAVSVAGATEGTAPEPKAAVAPKIVVGAHDDALSGASTEVVVREPGIQDVAPICSAPMAEATSTCRSVLELLVDDIVDSAIVARNLELMRHAEQWMKIRYRTLSSRIPRSSEYSTNMFPCAGCRGEIPTKI